MTSPGRQHDDFSPTTSTQPAIVQQSSADTTPTALHIPKNHSAGNLLSLSSSSSSLHSEARRTRLSFDAASTSAAEYDQLRSPILSERDTGLRRIRQYPTQRQSSSSLTDEPPTHVSLPPSRNLSVSLQSGPSSPTLAFTEDLSRFPSESLHSFSFAHQSEDHLYSRQNVLKRSIEFMRDKLGWASTSPRVLSAQAKLSGDQELLSMMELLQKAHILGPQGLSVGLGIDTAGAAYGPGGIGPLTGPVHPTGENVFEKSFIPQAESPTDMDAPAFADSARGRTFSDATLSPTSLDSETSEQDGSDAEKFTRITSEDSSAISQQLSRPPPRGRASLKRTYTDVSGLSLQHRLTEALAQPYHSSEQTHLGQKAAPTVHTTQHSNTRQSTLGPSGAPHGHRSRHEPAAQAIFTTESQAPWTITAANDLACLVFGVTRAEVRKLGIMEVIREERRKWLEEKLRNPDSGTAPRPSVTRHVSPASGAMGNGVTAKLLSKPPARAAYASRRSKTDDGSKSPKAALNHLPSKSRGVLLCGDVVPIQKRNGTFGAASLWVKEKQGGLIWVLEEIAEDVANLTVDEIGSVIRGSGDVEAIWGLERVRRGMDVQKLIPKFPKLTGTHTGALDYDAVARLRRFTARTSNSINIPITIDQLEGESTFRVSSFPHIAGIMVLNSSTLKVSSSNSVFSAALFGHSNPDGMLITDLIPGFDKILRLMTDEDKIGLVDGIVIPEHSFRRARALLALREGSADAAAIFLRPSGLPARHRDGAQIMIDVQMRVVKSDKDPIYTETVIEEGDSEGAANASQPAGSEVVYALWITYSRQLHAVNHGIGPVTPLMSRPGTPPHQPSPGQPSPIVAGDTDGEDTPQSESTPVSMLTQQLQDVKGQNLAESEPFEHPAPEVLTTGAKVIKKKSINDFVILEEMGQGAYGQVKLARYKKANAKKMVIKYVTKRRILVDTWHRDRRLGTVPLEIHVLDYLRRDGLQHPNIVEMADFFEDDTNYYIEMVPHGLPGMDLFDYIELRVTMEERECRKIFVQVASALQHLHCVAKVVHRDIKDENVILDGDGAVKLVDFGSAAYIKSGPFDVFVGTIDYAAPEVLRGSPYRGKEQDVWALGILLYTIVYKENPFYSIDEIMDHDLRVPYIMSEDCIDLIRKMLDRDVERRIGIQAVLDHPWCTFVDPEDE